MKTENQEITIELTSKMLGTVPKSDVYEKYIATKAPKTENGEEEVQTAQDIEDKGWTGFHKDENGLFIYSYMIKGFLKSACEVLMANGAINKIPAYKKWFDNLVFINPRRLHFQLHEPDGVLERPLRTMSPKGPRVALTRSDYISESRTLTFDVEVLKNNKKIDMDLINQCLEYGKYVGLGQWRGSGGYGRFQVMALGVVMCSLV